MYSVEIDCSHVLQKVCTLAHSLSYLLAGSFWCVQVTKRVDDGGSDYGGWQNWNWRSSGDLFLNGAFFTDSGASNIDSSLYAKATSFSAQPSSYVGTLTANAGPFQCGPGVHFRPISVFLYLLNFSATPA